MTAVRLGRWGIAAGVAAGLVVGSVATVGAEERGRSYEARDNGGTQAPTKFVAEVDSVATAKEKEIMTQ